VRSRGQDNCSAARASGAALSARKRGTDALTKYLQRYAEPLARSIPTSISRYAQKYEWCLIIPAFDEPAGFLETLLPKRCPSLLVIVVINAPKAATAVQRQRTAALLPEPGTLVCIRNLAARSGVDVLFIDALTEPLPTDQATGLARKLGNDCACALIQAGVVQRSVLCNTDADAVLPEDYFGRVADASEPNCGALVLPFRHIPMAAQGFDAGQHYELYLRLLRAQLATAGSPYAYPALGSLLVLDAQAYAKVRGFPKRAAGEDFHMLNKLAKITTVAYIKGAPIQLAARPSERVPFGTGPSVVQLSAALSAQGELACKCYSDTSFAMLRQFYAGFAELGSQPTQQPNQWRDPDIAQLLKHLNLASALAQLRANHHNNAALRRALHEWFDALKAVRFLNAARRFHPDTPVLPRARTWLCLPDASPAQLNQREEEQRPRSYHGIGRLIYDNR